MWSLGTCFCILEVFTKFLAQKAKIDPNIVLRIDEKTVFRSPKICVFDYMLLHNSYINVAIVNILLYWKSL